MLQQCLPLLISPEIRKPQSRIFLSPTQRHLPSAQHVVLNLAVNDTICCVISLTCDAPRSSRKQCFAYFLTVVHFRKMRNNIKVGSGRNGHPVI